MDTTRNRSAVLAKAIRSATQDVREGASMRSALIIAHACECLDTVADELEAVAAGRDLPNPPPSPPDPAEAPTRG
jgi:hypothetical protein